MNNERIIGNDSKSDVVTFDVKLDGKPMDQRYHVLSVVVQKAVNRIATAKIVLRKEEESPTEGFPLSNKSDFVPGKKVEVMAGRDRNHDMIFKGIIVKHALKVKQDGSGILKLECKDECVKLTVGRQNRCFEKKKDSDIFKSILKQYGIKAQVEDSAVEYAELIQHHVSDWDFILSRADINGKLVFVENGNVRIESPKTSGNPVETLILGATLHEVEMEMDARYQYNKVEATAWNPAKQKIEKANVSTVDFQDNGNLSGKTLSDVIGLAKYDLKHSGSIPMEGLKEWAKAGLQKSRLAKIMGRAKCLGIASLQPGVLVDLKGISDRFNGKVYMTAVQHELVEGSWYAHIQFGLKPNWFHQDNADVMDAPAGGRSPGVNGLHIGKVVKIDGDPESQFRVRVNLPAEDGQQRLIWARLANVDAGADRGVVFRPEKDDEVVVGFLNGDPCDPIILGSLHSKKMKSPIKDEAANPEKGVITKDGLKLLFNDQKKTITLETPGNNKIVIDGTMNSIVLQDGNQNKVELGPAGITIQSATNITLTAGAALTLGANALAFSASGAVNMTADGTFSLEGKQGTNLCSPMTTKIEGAMVEIN